MGGAAAIAAEWRQEAGHRRALTGWLSRWWPVAALCLAGTALRWPDAVRFLEYDEVISLLFARLDFARLVDATAADTMPPLYYWLLHLWNGAAGENVFNARLLSTLLGVAAIPLVYLLGERLLGRREALIGAGLMAVSPFPVFYGHYARMYALLALLALAAALCFARWLHGGRAPDAALFTVCTALSLYAHNLAVLLLGAFDVAFLLGVRRRLWPARARLRTLVLIHAALLMLYLPWLAYLPGQVAKLNRAFWIPVPGPAELFRTPTLFLFHLPLPPVLLGPAVFVAVLAAVVTAIETVRMWRHHESRSELMFLGCFALVPVASMFLISQVRPVYVERGVMASAAACYLLLAAALLRVRTRPVAWGLAAAVGALVVSANVYQFTYEQFPRSPYYQAAAYLEARVGPDDVVLHDNKLSYFPSYYLAPALSQTYLPDPPGSPNDTLAPETAAVLGLPPSSLPDAVAGRSGVWFVVYRRALQEAAAAGRPSANKAWLDHQFGMAPEPVYEVGGLLIYRYHAGNP